MLIRAGIRDACSSFAQVQAMHPKHASHTETTTMWMAVAQGSLVARIWLSMNWQFNISWPLVVVSHAVMLLSLAPCSYMEDSSSATQVMMFSGPAW